MKLLILTCLLAAAFGAPSYPAVEYPAGVSPLECPNYPYCDPAPEPVYAPVAAPAYAPVAAPVYTPVAAPVPPPLPVTSLAHTPEQLKALQAQFSLSQPLVPEVPGLAAHQAAEAEVLASQGRTPGQLTHALAEARVLQAQAEIASLDNHYYH